jgi:hypothetical protein
MPRTIGRLIIVQDEQFRGFFPMVSENQMSQTIDRVANAAT